MTIPYRSCLCAIWLAASATIGAQSPRASQAVRISGIGPETFVLLSGIVGGTAGYRRLEALLVERGYRVIVIDPFLLSIDSADVSFAAMARRAHSVLRRAGITDARLVGHERGAGVMLRLAATCSLRVSHLYFLDAGALATNQSPLLARSLRLAAFVSRLPHGRAYVRHRFLDGLRENSGSHEWLDAETQHAYMDPILDRLGAARALAARLGRSAEPESVADVVTRIRTPATVILGDVPHDSGPTAEELPALAPLGALLRVERLAGVGHFPHEEAPAEVLRILLESAVATIAETRAR